jgi:hypothetical protein
MKLPNGTRAVVEDDKLRDYVLNASHPVGRHHAILFQKLLGINWANAQVLKQALLTAAIEEDVTREIPTPFGLKYEMRFVVRGPRGVKDLLAVWIINEGTDYPPVW